MIQKINYLNRKIFRLKTQTINQKFSANSLTTEQTETGFM